MSRLYTIARIVATPDYIFAALREELGELPYSLTWAYTLVGPFGHAMHAGRYDTFEDCQAAAIEHCNRLNQ